MLTITHQHNRVVCVSGVEFVNYDDKLDLAHHILHHFKATNSNTWGCDGVGYSIEKAKGNIRVMKSTIGPRNFKKGLDSIKQCLTCKDEVQL